MKSLINCINESLYGDNFKDYFKYILDSRGKGILKVKDVFNTFKGVDIREQPIGNVVIGARGELENCVIIKSNGNKNIYDELIKLNNKYSNYKIYVSAPIKDKNYNVEEGDLLGLIELPDKEEDEYDINWYCEVSVNKEHRIPRSEASKLLY